MSDRDPGLRPGATRLERLLLRLALLALGVVVALQAMGGPRVTETFLSYAERLEGPPETLPATAPAGSAPAGPAGGSWLVVLLVSAPREESACLLVNGWPVAGFSQPEATVLVDDGDELAVDAQGTPDELRLRVVAGSPELLWPRLGQEFACRGLAALGVVRCGAR